VLAARVAPRLGTSPFINKLRQDLRLPPPSHDPRVRLKRLIPSHASRREHVPRTCKLTYSHRLLFETRPRPSRLFYILWGFCMEDALLRS